MKQVSRSFSSEELSAWVRTVDNEDELWIIAVLEDSLGVFGCGWSWDNRSAKESSVDWDCVPFTWVVGGSAPVETMAVDSLYGFDVFVSF